jgi:hypothetical protein
VQITSDQCVRYTGIDIPVLGIKTGDSLSYVEQALIGFLTSTLDGSGIIIDKTQLDLCELVTSNLPTCGNLSVVDILNALVKSVCSLQAQITTINGSITSINTELDEINSPYAIPSCLEGLTASSTTHQVLQNVIEAFCQFVEDVGVTYVTVTELPILIGQYLQEQGTSTKYYTKMVPYVAMEFYPTPGTLNNFDSTGKGIAGTNWEKVYLCNGLNGTPDKRGVVAVGVTDGTMLGGTMNVLVNPATTGNPTYIYNGGIVGTNRVALSTDNMPSHTHVAAANVSPNPHTHTVQEYAGTNSSGNHISATTVGTQSGTLTEPTTLTVAVTNAPSGGDVPHNNYQPGIGCYYIMYIP